MPNDKRQFSSRRQQAEISGIAIRQSLYAAENIGDMEHARTYTGALPPAESTGVVRGYYTVVVGTSLKVVSCSALEV